MKRHWRNRPYVSARRVVGLTCVLFLAGDTAFEHPMLPAAQRLVDLFEDSQRNQLILPFNSNERTNWSYLPGRRGGVALGEMTDHQRKSAFALIRTALSDAGYRKTTEVIELEGVLREMERNDSRDPDRYWFTLFGSPSKSSRWGWRVEGHHLSFNFASVTSELISATPAFLGAHPATVLFGERKGLRVLGAEEDLARGLIGSLSSEQKRIAIVSTSAPRDIITGTNRKARLSRFEGISYKSLTHGQQKDLLALLELYIGNMEKTIADRSWERIRNAGVDAIYFAWAGTITPGGAHYYRIHGPTFVVEYDNTQNNANHVHSVWRDFENDFGDDLLKKHYRQEQHE